MCGRFALFSDPISIAQALRLSPPSEDWQPRYNVAPGTWIISVLRPDPNAALRFENLWWGYRPHWADEKAPQPINAKAESVATSRYFRGAFSHHRCLVPADGWFEWLPVDGKKQPHYLTRTDGEPLWLAGIWAERADGKPGCAILTEPARGVAKEVHPRMPLALDADSLESWLDPHLTDRETIRQVVRHLDAKLLRRWAVSQRVNRPTFDDPSVIEPADA
ncbi:SOS response-associated peptidase [Billgrantia montanilacus]|uniref:Abasic site processing protein n=1 Tax=Billgrantia montanilacus TaxID=2282305 RepID=A0A368TS41_9GAMM|nr:SOS response-associated peptidase [Halomonas montanilacus]RCV86932.1 SOS response-associated peptidase [Halomonas montanilacus]